MQHDPHRIRTIYQRCSGFMQRQGVIIITAACLAVIVASAVWKSRMDASAPPAAQPALQPMQQRLADAATPSPAPTAAPPRYQPPLPEAPVLTPFDDTRLVYHAASRLWSLHDAIDLQAAPDTPVLAMADGVVLSIETKGPRSVCVTIDHGEDMIAACCGLRSASVSPGDRVKSGQTIGLTGSGPADERDLPPHLHLRVLCASKAIDPAQLWTGAP